MQKIYIVINYITMDFLSVGDDKGGRWLIHYKTS